MIFSIKMKKKFYRFLVSHFQYGAIEGNLL